MVYDRVLGLPKMDTEWRRAALHASFARMCRLADHVLGIAASRFGCSAFAHVLSGSHLNVIMCQTNATAGFLLLGGH